MKYCVFIIAFCLVSCNSAFERRALKNANTQEILAFKEYLLRTDAVKGFKEYIIISYTDADSLTQAFFRKYKIARIYVYPCTDKDQRSNGNFFKNCGHQVCLWYDKTPFVETNHSMIFDYSDDGLELLDGISAKKHKVADRVFVF